MAVLGLTHFYRYSAIANPERLERIVLQHEIYLPTVTQLNDPADARPRFVGIGATNGSFHPPLVAGEEPDGDSYGPR